MASILDMLSTEMGGDQSIQLSFVGQVLLEMLLTEMGEDQRTELPLLVKHCLLEQLLTEVGEEQAYSFHL